MYVVTLCDIYYMMDWTQMVMVQMLLDFEIGMSLVTMLGGGNVMPSLVMVVSDGVGVSGG